MKLLNKLLLLSSIFLTFTLTAYSDALPGKAFLVEKYQKQLETTTTAIDSVKKLYCIFDLSDRHGQIPIAWQIYETAGRANDLPTQMDMLRNLAVFYQSMDSMTTELLKLADRIPNPDARASTKTFIYNQRLSRRSRKPDRTMQAELLDSIRFSHDLQGNNVYDKLSLLYQIMQYLGVNSDGVLFNECLDRYSEIIEALPSSDYPLKNQFYTTAAIVNSRLNGNPQKAIRYDRMLLNIIDQLQQMYAKKQRTFRNYNSNKYICYRRMLSNYKALEREEVEALYDSIMGLCEIDSDVKRSVETFQEPIAYYAMATKDYTRAIPAIFKALHDKNISTQQRQRFYAMMMHAAKAIDDQDSYITAMEGLIKHTLEIDSLRKITMQRESLLRDSFLTAPLLFEEKAQEVKPSYIKMSKSLTTMIIMSAVLALLLIVYLTLYVRLRLKKSSH